MIALQDRNDLARRLNLGHCPDCGERGFVLGPNGGINQNIECANVDCRQRFNVAVYAGEVIHAHRIESVADGGLAWPSEPKPMRIVEP